MVVLQIKVILLLKVDWGVGKVYGLSTIHDDVSHDNGGLKIFEEVVTLYDQIVLVRDRELVVFILIFFFCFS